MNNDLLYSKLPFLGSIREERRNTIIEYFKTAPDWLADFFKIEYLPANTVFIREGHPASYVYLIADGIVKATEYRIIGVEFDFIRFDKVYAMGGMEVLMHLPSYRTTLSTVTDCNVVRIPRNKYEQWLFNDLEAMKIESSMTCGISWSRLVWPGLIFSWKVLTALLFCWYANTKSTPKTAFTIPVLTDVT